MELLKKKVDAKLAIAIVLVVAVLVGYGVIAYAHHNSPMYEFIEEIENFDNMDMHEQAIDSLPDNSSMDNATERGTYTDTATQDGAAGGASGNTNQIRN